MRGLMISLWIVLCLVFVGCASMGEEVINITFNCNKGDLIGTPNGYASLSIKRNGLALIGECHQTIRFTDGKTSGSSIVTHDKKTIGALGAAAIGAISGGVATGTPAGAAAGAAVAVGTQQLDEYQKNKDTPTIK